jgi:hypothetical protein
MCWDARGARRVAAGGRAGSTAAAAGRCRLLAPHALAATPAAAARHSARARAVSVVAFKLDTPPGAGAAAAPLAASPAPVPAAPRLSAPGVVVAPPDAGVQLACAQPTYDVMISYSRVGRPLWWCDSITAHVGHSGWSNTADVALAPSAADPGVFEGVHSIPASQLANPAHAEVQVVFRGMGPGGREEWDNNGGRNWQVGPGPRRRRCDSFGQSARPIDSP